jgi:hypothetical protein
MRSRKGSAAAADAFRRSTLSADCRRFDALDRFENNADRMPAPER